MFLLWPLPERVLALGKRGLQAFSAIIVLKYVDFIAASCLLSFLQLGLGRFVMED